MIKSNVSLAILCAILVSCQPTTDRNKSSIQTSDQLATPETKALFANLDKVRETHIMFGHEDAVAYGLGWWNEPDRADVKAACGSYPAVYGWDIGKIGEERNIDSVRFDNMRKWMIEAYERGGINTVSWHKYDPETGANPWVPHGDTSTLVTDILPGGKKHNAFKKKLNAVGEFMLSLQTEAGVAVPVIFRPYHEHNGTWFWWGKSFCTEQEYQQLWHYTVHYLRDTMNVHNLLYAFSPDRSRMHNFTDHESFLYGYPGDEYIDIIGLDNYWDVHRKENNTPLAIQDSIFLHSLRVLVDIAESKNKVPTFTETGQLAIDQADWYTKVILDPIKQDTVARRIAYILVWRNSGHEFCVPVQGNPAYEDFIRFCEDPVIWLEDDLPDMYTLE